MSDPNPSLEEFLFEAALAKTSAAERTAFLDGFAMATRRFALASICCWKATLRRRPSSRPSLRGSRKSHLNRAWKMRGCSRFHSPDGQTPNQLEVLWNGSLLYNGNNLPVGIWTNLQLAVGASSTRALLQIRGRDDPSGLAVDDVRLYSITPPSLQNVTAAGSAVKVSWSAHVGLSYQLQYATQLDQPDWTNLGTALTATNVTMTLSDSTAPGGNAMRFYRVLLLP